MNPIQAQFQTKAYERAGVRAEHWDPSRGFSANALILNQIYRYYQAIYFENPDRFLWAGLARLTGGQVLYGMQNAVKIARDPCVLTQEIVAVAKDIFESLAWQHELFLDDPEQLIEVCNQLSVTHLSLHPYSDCWRLLQSEDSSKIAQGNKMLLENEQKHTIQPHYETIRKDPYANRYFRFTRFVMRNIHPHHRRFIFDVPLGDVTRFEDRWRWISHKKGMWPTWVGLNRKERDRLVALSNEDVVAHHW